MLIFHKKNIIKNADTIENDIKLAILSISTISIAIKQRLLELQGQCLNGCKQSTLSRRDFQMSQPRNATQEKHAC